MLFYLLGNRILERLPAFSGQGLGMVLYAYLRIGIDNEALLSACVRQAEAICDELQTLEVQLILGSLDRYGRLADSTRTLLLRRLAVLQPLDASLPAVDDVLDSLLAGGAEAEASGQVPEGGDGSAEDREDREDREDARAAAIRAYPGGCFLSIVTTSNKKKEKKK